MGRPDLWLFEGNLACYYHVDEIGKMHISCIAMPLALRGRRKRPKRVILYVGHSKNNHSGHLGHSLIQYAPARDSGALSERLHRQQGPLGKGVE